MVDISILTMVYNQLIRAGAPPCRKHGGQWISTWDLDAFGGWWFSPCGFQQHVDPMNEDVGMQPLFTGKRLQNPIFSLKSKLSVPAEAATAVLGVQSQGRLDAGENRSPPVITIFFSGGLVSIPSHGWFMTFFYPHYSSTGHPLIIHQSPWIIIINHD